MDRETEQSMSSSEIIMLRRMSEVTKIRGLGHFSVAVSAQENFDTTFFLKY